MYEYLSKIIKDEICKSSIEKERAVYEKRI